MHALFLYRNNFQVPRSSLKGKPVFVILYHRGFDVSDIFKVDYECIGSESGPVLSKGLLHSGSIWTSW